MARSDYYGHSPINTEGAGSVILPPPPRSLEQFIPKGTPYLGK